MTAPQPPAVLLRDLVTDWRNRKLTSPGPPEHARVGRDLAATLDHISRLTARPTQLDRSLTDREIEVLRYVADGLTNADIGERLDLSWKTIKSHLARLSLVLGADNRAHAVAIALRTGLIS